MSCEEKENRWGVSVLLCVLSAIIINVGTNLQKKSLREKTLLLWVVGLLAIIVGSLCDFGALAFGTQTVVAALGSISLVVNIFVAQKMHGETLERNDISATFLIILGSVIAVIFAKHQSRCEDDPLGVLELYRRPENISYAAVVFSLFVISVLAVLYVEKGGVKTMTNLHRFLYCFMSALAGAQSILIGKTLGEIVKNSFASDSTPTPKNSVYKHYGVYLLIIGLIVCIVLQLFCLNRALARYDALSVIPMFQAQLIVFGIIGGGVFYGEFLGYSPLNATMFAVGVGITLFGVYRLSKKEKKKNKV